MASKRIQSSVKARGSQKRPSPRRRLRPARTPARPVTAVSKPLIFISHSARQDPPTLRILKKIAARLKEDGFEVWWDEERLQGGDEWRQEINMYLGLCDGALILFSEKALASPWVKKEATNLIWRRSLDDDFKVLPVILTPVERQDLDTDDYAPLAINEIQTLRRETADRIAGRVSRTLEPLKQKLNLKSPWRRLENVIVMALREIEDRRPTALIEAALALGEQWGPWQPNLGGGGYSERLARLMMQSDLCAVTEAMRVLGPLFSDKKLAFKIIDILAIFWIDPFAVARLPGIRKLPRAQRAVCVNGEKYPFTSENYIRRASWATTDWVIVEISGAGEEERQVQTIEKEIRAALREKSTLPENYPYAEVEDFVSRREEKEPLFIIVPPKLAEEIVDELRQKFPAFIFFLLVGREVAEAEKRRLRDKYVLMLAPELQPDQEQTAFRQWVDARAVVNSAL
jgi:hypothetical protein